QAGSAFVSMHSTVRRARDSDVIGGRKLWVSDADTADYFLVFAKTDPKAGSKGVTAFMLDRASAGKALRTEPIKDRLGIRAGDVGTIVMAAAEVPVRDHIADGDAGIEIVKSCLH